MRIKAVYTNENKECKYVDYYKELIPLETITNNEQHKGIYIEDTEDYSKGLYAIPNCVKQQVAIELGQYLAVEEIEQNNIMQSRIYSCMKIVNDFKNIIKDLVNSKCWFTMAMIYYVKTYTYFGNEELIADMLSNREYIKNRNEEQRKQREQEIQERERARKEKEEQERKQFEELVEQKARENKWLMANEFLFLCDKYNVDMPIKVVGWAREWLGDVSLKEEKYYGNTKHKSTTIFNYIRQLKEKMGV